MKSNLENNDLIHLIQCLNKAEKRYFKLTQKGISPKEKDYIRLFDYLLEQDSYAPKRIRAHFEGAAFLKRLPAVKLYLYTAILKSLRPLSRGQSIAQEIQHLIFDTELLYKKGLYQQCLILLDRAKKMADVHEINFLRLQILRIQRQYAVEHFKQMKVYSPTEIREEEMLILNQMRMINVNEGLANSLHTMLFKEGSIRTQEELDEVRTIGVEALQYEAESKVAFRSEFLNLYLIGDTSFVIGEFERSIAYGKKQIDIWEDNPRQLEKNPTDYMKSFNTLFQRALRCGRHDVFEENIDRLENFMEVVKKRKSIPLEVVGFIRISSNYFYYYTKTGQFNAAITYFGSIKEQLQLYESYMDEGALIEQQFLIAYAHFGNGDLVQAKKWLNKILNAPNLTLKNDLQVVCRVFEIVIYLEQKELEVAENRIPRLNRFLSKLDRLYPYEAAIISCLKLLLNKKMGGHSILDQSQFDTALAIIEKGPLSYSSFYYFDIYAWLVAQKENRSFQEIVKTTNRTIA